MGQVSSTISRLAPILSPGIVGLANTAVGAYQTLTGPSDRDVYIDQQDLALKQLQQTQKQQTRNAQEQAALDRDKIAADADAAEQSRLAALRRAVARQKAAYGDSGIAIDDASPQAVLLGLSSESEGEKTQREQMDAIKNSVIDQGLAAQQRANILELSQLKERQKLARISEGY
jgi:hypothetical protein